MEFNKRRIAGAVQRIWWCDKCQDTSVIFLLFALLPCCLPFFLFGLFLDTHGDGRPRGFGHVEFTNKEQAVACFTSAMEEPIYFGGRDLVVDYAKDNSYKAQEIEPNNRLYFVGCAEGESALKDIFSAHSENIISIYYCELSMALDMSFLKWFRFSKGRKYRKPYSARFHWV